MSTGASQTAARSRAEAVGVLVGDFLDVRIGPDGTPWGAFVREEPSQGIIGRLLGSRSLLDASS